MHQRRIRRRLLIRFAALPAASAPSLAFAADPALSAWGAYFFFAIVATVVIVLLLHEALEDDRSEIESAPRDDQAGDVRAHTPAAAGFGAAAASGDTAKRRAA